MLRALSIRDMLLIDRLDLELRPGLNVLTGETGAGKSILLDALGFVLGWRGRAALVREGAERGEVVAAFDVAADHPAREILAEAGIEAEEEILLRRVNTVDGRKTAWISDRRVSGEILRRLSETLVELHGQHDDRGLLDARGHRGLLDDFAQARDLREEVAVAWSGRRGAEKALSEAEAALETARSEEEYLRHAVAELDTLDPQPGEEAALDTARRRMQAAERVREDIARAHQALGFEGAEGMLGDAARRLDAAAEGVEGALDAPIEALARCLDALAEAEQGVAQALESLDYDPAELEQDRGAALRDPRARPQARRAARRSGLPCRGAPRPARGARCRGGGHRAAARGAGGGGGDL